MVTTVHGQLRATGGLGGLALTKEAQGRSEGGAVQAGAGAGPGAEAGEVREAVQRRRAGWADPCRPRPAQRGAVLCVAAPQPGSAAWRKGIQTARWPAHAVKPLLKSPGRPSGRRWEGQAKGHARVRRTERRRAQAAAVARVGARAGCVTHRRGCMAPPVPVCVCVRGRGGGVPPRSSAAVPAAVRFETLECSSCQARGREEGPSIGPPQAHPSIEWLVTRRRFGDYDSPLRRRGAPAVPARHGDAALSPPEHGCRLAAPAAHLPAADCARML